MSSTQDQDNELQFNYYSKIWSILPRSVLDPLMAEKEDLFLKFPISKKDKVPEIRLRQRPIDGPYPRIQKVCMKDCKNDEVLKGIKNGRFTRFLVKND